MIEKELDQIFRESFHTTIKLRSLWDSGVETIEIFKNPTKDEVLGLESIKQYRECRVFLLPNEWYVASAIKVVHSQIMNALPELRDAFGITVRLEKNAPYATVTASGDAPGLASGEIEFVKKHPFVNSLKSFGIKELRIQDQNVKL